MIVGVLGLAIFAGVYSIYGGLKAVALTDVIQVYNDPLAYAELILNGEPEECRNAAGSHGLED